MRSKEKFDPQCIYSEKENRHLIKEELRKNRCFAIEILTEKI